MVLRGVEESMRSLTRNLGGIFGKVQNGRLACVEWPWDG